MKKSLLAVSIILGSTFATGAAHAEQTWEDTAKDAWIDGKAEATLLFNGNLNSFDINTDVADGVVVLTGKVESDVDRKLAEELVLGIDGVESVDNKLTVYAHKKGSSEDTTALTDAKIATVIKSRLLFDTDISGMDIDVDVKNGVVTLKGEVESDAEKDLAIQIARNATDVRDIKADLKVVKAS